jgi:murein DD-endopeptidase MepM/ murein hydrolase activator NlpD
MGRKISIELPKYRLQMHVRLVKRRKPLLDLEEPIIVKPSRVQKKYRTGTLLGKLARHFTSLKNIRKIFATGFAALAVATIIYPHPSNIEAQASDPVIIESQTNLVTEKSMIYPVGKVIINQSYGVFHKAIDFGGILGTSIKPIMDGIVAYAGWDRSGYGNLIVLQHKNGIVSYYAHLSKIEVVTGQSVTTSTEIGKMGATGHATGVHLHLEILQNGVSLNPLTVLSR